MHLEKASNSVLRKHVWPGSFVVMAPTSDGTRIEVSVQRQSMDVLRGEELIARYAISTSRFGLGSEPGSFKTPLGRFVISEKFGDEAPLGGIFRGRVFTGETSPPDEGEDDLITTRILWLDGLEPENQNTKSRFIYIHGTNHEERLGTPASHGCVRMRNSDIATLYELVGPGTPVAIT